MNAKRFWKRIGRPYAFLSPSLILLCMIFVFPMLYSFYMSLHSYSLLRVHLGMRFVGLQNYLTFLSTDGFLESLWVTLRFAFFSVLFELIFGFAMALLFNQTMFARSFFRSFLLFPMMLAGVVVGSMWRIILNDQFGVLNVIVNMVGISSQAWLANPNLVLPTLILTDVWQNTPFVFVVLLAGLQSIPLELYEAASVDGANALKKLIRITIPLVWPMISIVIVIRSMDAFRIFDRVWLLTKGGPGMSTMMMSVYNYRETFVNMNIGYGSAISWVILLILLVVSVFYLRLIERDHAY